MIRVQPQPEPASFEEVVRIPGKDYLLTNPTPTSKEFNSHAYWRKILRELRNAYSRVCAYSSFYVPAATGTDTVEHFLPKVQHPQSAYEWSNYRFVCHTLNSKKSTKEDVVDPFVIGSGWFIIEFPSLMVKPGQGLSAEVKTSVEKSIESIGLNDPATCLEQRVTFIANYCLGRVDFDYLRTDAPFLAGEIQRQDLIEKVKVMMRYSPNMVDEFDRLLAKCNTP